MKFDEVSEAEVRAFDGTVYTVSLLLDRPGHSQLLLQENGLHAGYATMDRSTFGDFRVNVGHLHDIVVYTGNDAQEGVNALHSYLYGVTGLRD